MSRWLPLFPASASTMADRVDNLFVFLMLSSTLITVVIFLCLLVFSIRYRRRPGNEVARQISGSWKLETTWTLIPLGLAFIPFYWGATLYFDMSTPPDDALNVYVVARQWMWKVEHPDGQSEIDELHVPVGRPVRLTMISQDVIHSFYVPEFRMKMDVLPGRYTTAWFTATSPGRYRLECAEFCGTDHSRMTGWIVVMDPPEFANWLTTQGTQSLASQGDRLFQQLGCNGCHRADSLGRAPALEGLYGQPVRFQDGTQTRADDAYIRTSIVNPNAQVVDGWQPIMPTFQGQLSEEQLLALVAYIRSIGPGPGAPAPELRPSPPPRPPVAPYSDATPLPSPLPPPPLLPGEVPLAPPSPVGSAQGTQPLATQGARLFQQLGCIACHRDDGLGPAPALVGVYGQPVHLQDGSQTVADDAYVRRSILDPTAQVVDGWQPIMPSFQGRVNEDEMSALIAYIRSIGPAGSTQTPEIPPSPSPVPSPSGSPTP